MKTYKAVYGIMKSPTLYWVSDISQKLPCYEVRNIFFEGTEEEHKMLKEQLEDDGYTFVPSGTLLAS